MGGAEDMAERAYIRLGHRSENQAVLFLYVVFCLCQPCGVTLLLTAETIGVNRAQERLPSVLTF